MLLILGKTYGQSHVRISMGVNYGSFSMSDMKQLQEEFLDDLSMDLKHGRITDNFPAFFGVDGSVAWDSYKFLLGLEVGYNSTAGRIAYSDYSGKIIVDQFVRAPRVAFSWSWKLRPHNSKWEPLLIFNGGLIFNTYKVNYLLQTTNTRHIDELKFKSINPYLSFGAGINRRIGRFFLSGRLQYQKDIPSDVHLSSDADVKLLNDDGENVGVDWSGIRVAAAIGLRL